MHWSLKYTVTVHIVETCDAFRTVAPSFDDKTEDVSVKEGEAVTVKLTVKSNNEYSISKRCTGFLEVKEFCLSPGEPAPEVTCLKDGELLPSDLSCSVVEGCVTLKTASAKPEHSGKYVVTARNAGGEDSCSFSLTVAGWSLNMRLESYRIHSDKYFLQRKPRARKTWNLCKTFSRKLNRSRHLLRKKCSSSRCVLVQTFVFHHRP